MRRLAIQITKLDILKVHSDFVTKFKRSCDITTYQYKRWLNLRKLFKKGWQITL
jgi:hypothetical protein